jgi:hypothetical protein
MKVSTSKKTKKKKLNKIEIKAERHKYKMAERQ